MKFDMSEAWREAVAMMTGNREVLLIVAGIFFLLPSIALSLSIGEIQESIIADPESARAQILALYSDWWWLLIVVLLALGSVVGLVWSVRREKAVQAQLRDLPNPPDQPAPSL